MFFRIGWIVTLAGLLVGCADVPKNRVDGHVPAPMACPVETDPDCTGAATVGVQVPLIGSEPVIQKDELRSILGRCEMYIEGQLTPVPCSDIRLVIRSTRENEERTATIDGYNFAFRDLNQSSYRIMASSPLYELQTDQKDMVNPGQTLKIRLKAKRRH